MSGQMAASAPTPKTASSSESRQKVMTDPTVRRTLDLFGGTLVDVQPAPSVTEVTDDGTPAVPNGLTANTQPE